MFCWPWKSSLPPRTTSVPFLGVTLLKRAITYSTSSRKLPSPTPILRKRSDKPLVPPWDPGFWSVGSNRHLSTTSEGMGESGNADYRDREDECGGSVRGYSLTNIHRDDVRKGNFTARPAIGCNLDRAKWPRTDPFFSIADTSGINI